MKKLSITQEQFESLEKGFVAVVKIPCEVSRSSSVQDRLFVLSQFPLKSGSLSAGVLPDGRKLALVVGAVTLNPGEGCFDVPVLSQYEALL